MTTTQTPTTTKTLPKSLGEQLIRARVASVSNPEHKNPFHFTQALDQQAAAFAKAKRIISNPKFNALHPEAKAATLSKYYDKYISPIYTRSGLAVPDKDVWVREIQKDHMKVEDFYANMSHGGDAGDRFQGGVENAVVGATAQGYKIGQGIILAGVAADRKLLGLANFLPGSALQKWASSAIARGIENEQKIEKPAMNLAQDGIDYATFWHDTHPSRSFVEKAGSFVGEQVAQLPVYEALKVVQVGMFAKAVANTGKLGKAANFTRALTASKTGQFIAKRLGDATDGYLGTALTDPNSTPGDRLANAIGFSAFGTGIDALGGGIKIGRRLMKKQAAEVMAAGGKVFHDSLIDQAAHEMDHGIVGTDAAGEPIHHVEGHFEEQNEAAHQADPVKHKLVTAEKLNLNVIAMEHYGKRWHELAGDEQKNAVRLAYAKIQEQALTEIPIHVPEVSKHETQNKIDSWIKANPKAAQTQKLIEGITKLKMVDAAAAEEAESIKVETGIKNTNGLARKIAKNVQKADKAKEMMNAPRHYVSFKTDTLQRFTNKIGEKAHLKNQRLTEFLKDMDDDDFVMEVNDQLGGQIKFEKPIDALFYGLHNEEFLPIPIRNKIQRTLQSMDPGGTLPGWRAQARALDNHIHDLAKTGHLDTEGNVFRTTVTHSYTSRTIWQKELNAERAQKELEEFEAVMGVTKAQHPEEYNAALKELTKLQALRIKAKSFDTAREITDKITSMTSGGK